MEKLIIIGAGGYAKSVIDSIDYSKYKVSGFIDEVSNKKQHLGINIIGKSLSDINNKEQYVYFIAIGDNSNRKKWYDRIKEEKLRLINVIDKNAIISSRATIGTGCFFGKLAVVNSNAIIGDNVIINTRALVEHGCNIENHANISTNTVVNGDVKVGEGSFVGSSSVTIGQLNIGEWSTIGAGSVVIRNVLENTTVVGIPARVVIKE